MSYLNHILYATRQAVNYVYMNYLFLPYWNFHGINTYLPSEKEDSRTSKYEYVCGSPP